MGAAPRYNADAAREHGAFEDEDDVTVQHFSILSTLSAQELPARGLGRRSPNMRNTSVWGLTAYQLNYPKWN